MAVEAIQLPEAEREVLYQKYRDLFRPDMTIWSFSGTIRTKNQALEAWLAWGVIPDFQNCRCGCKMRPHRDESYGLGFVWRCFTKEHPEKCPRRGTFFERAHICPLAAARLMFHFLVKDKLTFAAVSTGLSKKTVVDWYNFFREVCDVSQDHDFCPIGGSRDIVEVDESHLFTRKYRRGRLLAAEREQVWVFGAISRCTGDMWIEKIRNKARYTLDAIMTAKIQPGSFIMSDEHRSYRGCAARLQMKGHATVNHKSRFVEGTVQVPGLCPRLGRTISDHTDHREVDVHTNTVERQWRELKKALATCRSIPRVPMYIGEFLYRRNVLRHLPSYGEQLAQFLQDLRRQYPGYPGYDKRVQRPGICVCLICRPRQVRRRNRLI